MALGSARWGILLTLGIDLASEPAKTGICLLDWKSGTPVVQATGAKADDEELKALIRKADRVGIDVPLGWPSAFTMAVGRWALGEKWPHSDHQLSKRELRYRVTDLELGKDPLSVSSDRIAVPAFRAAAILSELNLHVPRDGSGKIVEVYPFASLRSWLGKAPPPAYKKPDGRAERRAMMAKLLKALGHEPGEFAEFKEACLAIHDTFDAFVASLTARAAHLGLTKGPTPSQLDAAMAEGWIHVPEPGSLRQLCTDRQGRAR